MALERERAFPFRAALLPCDAGFPYVRCRKNWRTDNDPPESVLRYDEHSLQRELGRVVTPT